MIPSAVATSSPVLLYPDSDGMRMADNTEQLRWMVLLFGNLCALFRDVVDIFVGADLLWYPVEGQPEVRQAPAVLVVFGRPKGKRGSYMQWLEGNVPITVAFEILSPSNTVEEMIDKHAFYEDHGVEEYYVYNPETNRLHVYLRKGELLLRRRFATEFVSPQLGIRFDLTGSELTVYRPDGQRFLSPEEQDAARVQAEQRTRRLAELSRKARLGQASPEELAVLEQLERDLTA